MHSFTCPRCGKHNERDTLLTAQRIHFRYACNYCFVDHRTGKVDQFQRAVYFFLHVGVYVAASIVPLAIIVFNMPEGGQTLAGRAVAVGGMLAAFLLGVYTWRKPTPKK